MQPIDIILTSCGRFDLLERTLESFHRHNTYPVREFHIYDDSGFERWDAQHHEAVARIETLYPDVIFHAGDKRIGQIEAMCYLMQFVTTPYYFTCEDDWEFIEDGFIEDSMTVLEQHPDIIQCWLRSQSDTNGHPVIAYNGVCSLMSTKYEWKGFSFNPALRRFSDYVPYNTITKFIHNDPSRSERDIGDYYHKLGKQAAILNKGYVEHIGGGRGVR